ncbi:MAG: DUF4258 domain-containing protein [Cyclonatronaceae bacterium]
MQPTTNLTTHAARRCDQRGINRADINIVLQFGVLIHRQGLCFYVLRNKDIPATVNAHRRGRIKNLVVVTPIDDPDTIITVYRNADAVKHIKRKPANLLC